MMTLFGIVIFALGVLGVISLLLLMFGSWGEDEELTLKWPPTEVLGTLTNAELLALGEENLDWWNQQCELMGLKSAQKMPTRRQPDMIDRVLAKAAEDPRIQVTLKVPQGKHAIETSDLATLSGLQALAYRKPSEILRGGMHPWDY